MKISKQIDIMIEDFKHLKRRIKKLEKENKIMSCNLKKLGKHLIKQEIKKGAVSNEKKKEGK